MHCDNGRLTLGRMQNPVRGILHGTAAVLSVAGAGGLWIRSSGGPFTTEVFHLCVVAGSAAHYAMTFAYVARFSG